MVESFELVMLVLMVGLLLACNIDSIESVYKCKLSNKSTSFNSPTVTTDLNNPAQQAFCFEYNISDSVAKEVNQNSQPIIYIVNGDFSKISIKPNKLRT